MAEWFAQDTFKVTRKLTLDLGDMTLQLSYYGISHSDSDILIFCPEEKLLATGDVFTPSSYPVIDLDRGGTVQGEIDALNAILDTAIPEFRLEGGTFIVPGHGHMSDSADVAYYRDMLTIIRDQTKALIEQGLTLQQVLEKRPTFGYEGRFGTKTGPWTTDMFITAVYRSLKERAK